jgi:methylene-tetrahydromethanopterin dehydrogenase
LNILPIARSGEKQMQPLEITPLKNKKLTVFIIEKEYNEPFWLIDPPSNGTPSKTLRHLFRPSIAFIKFLEMLNDKVKPDFATEELGMRTTKEFQEKNNLAKLFLKKKVPYLPVDIDENARGYLATDLTGKAEARDQVLHALSKLDKKDGENVDEEYLVAYGQSLQLELEEMEQEVNFSVRENWIIMGILDQAKEVEGKEEIVSIHVSSPEHVKGITRILESLDVQVENLTLSKRVISAYNKGSSSKELEDLVKAMQIFAKPIVKKPSDESPYILFYMDTDKRASSFDICMAYDAGFKAVVPYENVSVEDAKKIVQDAMFSRGPKGIKHTSFFIGGRDAEKAEQVLETVKNTMFPPFETGVIVDPCGAYTTAAAAVAKVEDSIKSRELGSLADKTCAVFGTGPVGRIAAVLLSRLGCNVMIASLNPKRKDGVEYVEKLSNSIREKYGVNVEGVFAPNKEEKRKVLRRADVIFCAGTEGVRVIEKSLLEELKLLKVVADINAVPPLGVEGIKVNDDMREIISGIFTVGALTIGKLKYDLEKEILKEVRTNGKEVYNYSFAMQLARKLLQKKLSLAKMAITLEHPSRKH